MRECGPEECDLLDATREAMLADQRVEEEVGRDCLFAELRVELANLPDAERAADEESEEQLTETHGDPLFGLDDPSPHAGPDPG